MSPLTFLEQLYATHGALIDFALFCALFIALAVTGLSQFLPGRQGKAVAVVVGILLAGALSQVVRTNGYTIASLGPLAIFLVVLLVAGATYRLCRHLGVGSVGATLVALVVGLLVLDQGRIAQNATWLVPLAEVLIILAVPFLLLHEPSARPEKVAENPKHHRALVDALEQQRSLMVGTYAELRRLRTEVTKGRKSSAPQFAVLAQRIRATDQALIQTTTLISSLLKRLRRSGGSSTERARIMRRIREYESIVHDGASIATGHILMAEQRMRAGEFDAAALLVDKATVHLQGLTSIERDISDLARELRVLPAERH